MSGTSSPRNLAAQQAWQIGKELALSLALQDALSELVAERGIEYLDTFLERRLRRTLPQLQVHVDAVPEWAREDTAQQITGAEQALRDAVRATRADPSRVS